MLNRVSENIYVSTVSELTLEQYIHAHRKHCLNNHKQVRVNCNGMLQVAKTVLSCGYCTLPDAFNVVSLNVKYSAE